MRKAKEVAWIVVFLALVFPAAPLVGQEVSGPLAALETAPTRLDWRPLVEERMVLTVSGPGGLTIRRELSAGEAPSLSLSEETGTGLVDGNYSWELRVIPRRQARRGEGAGAEQSLVQSGHFSIQDGRFVTAGPSTDGAPGSRKPPLGSVNAKDFVEDGNLVVQGNACIGDACGTDDADLPPVLRLKSTNTAILFEDVEDPENLSGASRNWALRANPSDVDQFTLTDVDGVTNPLVVTGGAPQSSLFIWSNGDVGLGTSTPSEKVHVFENVDANTFLLVENPNTGTSAAGILRSKSDTALVNLIAHGSGRTLTRFGQTLGGWSELLQVSGNGLLLGTLGATPLILGTNNTARVTIGSAGGMTIHGNITATGTKNFAVADPTDSGQALYYAALEGPEAGTYFRGTARTSHGEAVIQLPDHFSSLTEAERLTVQLTPVGQWGQLYIAEKSPTRLVVRVAPGSGDLEFDYFVQGVRKGYLDYQVKRPNTLAQ